MVDWGTGSSCRDIGKPAMETSPIMVDWDTGSSCCALGTRILEIASPIHFYLATSSPVRDFATFFVGYPVPILAKFRQFYLSWPQVHLHGHMHDSPAFSGFSQNPTILPFMARSSPSWAQVPPFVIFQPL